MQGDNGDLWSIIDNMLTSRSGDNKVFKIKSNQEELSMEELLAKERNYEDIARNGLADAAAEAAAGLSLPPVTV